jgi:hypothetical protein
MEYRCRKKNTGISSFSREKHTKLKKSGFQREAKTLSTHSQRHFEDGLQKMHSYRQKIE